ncbi:MAG: phospho-N-acetylmuramoyl-pentapeptide-transferase [Propionibacteriaceae bacterium]|jgi:phospho-N-acetylmuramoyl-pentapeptide-transferase|nr:phospho-N-acetylmuramoyl-pentapeptide-transferase [Propionibacteriaceae bacterium]
MVNILIAGGIALLGTLLGTRFAISFLVKRGYGQFIRDDGPTSHHTKRGTPTMGGVVIIVATVLGYFLAHLFTWLMRPTASGAPPTASGLLALGIFVAMGAVGFADDWIKISKARSLGLHSRAKLALQTAVAVAFGVLVLMFPNDRGDTPATTAVSFLRDIPWLTLPAWAAVIWIVFIVASWSNAVNLTDGLDGLATGAAALVFASYAIINIWQYNQSCSWGTAGPQCYVVRDPYDLAVISLALAGACFGFLWWNASPAKIFMGDTGSLSIGGAFAALSVLTRTELLMLVVAGLFLVITLSVVLQVGWFKLSGGKRLFKMAPLQHHFELMGWAEVTIVIRFWIVGGLCAAVGLGLFYAEWTIPR